MSDLLWQNLASPQSNQQPNPVTLASAATIAPTTQLTFITGTTNIATITPPVTGYHKLVLIPTNASPPSLLTTGNIKTSLTTMAQNRPTVIYYDPSTAKYWD